MKLAAKFQGALDGMAYGAFHARIKPTRDSSVRSARRRPPLLLRRCSTQNSWHQLNRELYMNISLAKALRAFLIAVGITISIAVVVALVLLSVAQFLPEELSGGHIHWGDYSTPLTGVFSGGLIEFLIAFAGVTLAVLIAVLAMVFAMVVTALVLAVTAGALMLAAIVVGFPLIVVVAVTWWVVRRGIRQRQAAAI